MFERRKSAKPRALIQVNAMANNSDWSWGYCRSNSERTMTMNKQTIILAIAGAIIGAVVVGSASPSSAVPVSSSMTAFKQATLSDVTDIYYRRRYYGRRYYPGAAIGLGVVGAAAA